MHRVVLRHRYAVGAVFGAVTVLVTLAGCGADRGQMPAAHSAPTPTPTRSAAPTAASQLEQAAEAAAAAYEKSWQVTDQASRAGHYQLAALSRYFTGEVLKTITQNLDTYEQKGIVSKGAIVLHPYVAAVELLSNPPAVTIADCVDDRNDLLYYAGAGKLIDNVPGGFRAETTIMGNLDGTWKATDQFMDAEGTCKLR